MDTKGMSGYVVGLILMLLVLAVLFGMYLVSNGYFDISLIPRPG